MELLISFWLMLCHWVRFDRSENRQEIEDEVELLARQNLPYKIRTVKNKAGRTEHVLYVQEADRDYARYCTGWRPMGF